MRAGWVLVLAAIVACSGKTSSELDPNAKFTGLSPAECRAANTGACSSG